MLGLQHTAKGFGTKPLDVAALAIGGINQLLTIHKDPLSRCVGPLLLLLHRWRVVVLLWASGTLVTILTITMSLRWPLVFRCNRTAPGGENGQVGFGRRQGGEGVGVSSVERQVSYHFEYIHVLGAVELCGAKPPSPWTGSRPAAPLQPPVLSPCKSSGPLASPVHDILRVCQVHCVRPVKDTALCQGCTGPVAVQ